MNVPDVVLVVLLFEVLFAALENVVLVEALEAPPAMFCMIFCIMVCNPSDKFPLDA